MKLVKNIITSVTLGLALAACSGNYLTEREVRATIKECLGDKSKTDPVKSVELITLKNPNEFVAHFILPSLDPERNLINMKMVSTFIVDQTGDLYLTSFNAEDGYRYSVISAQMHGIRKCVASLPLAVR